MDGQRTNANVSETFTCTHCQGEHALTERTEFNGQDLCPDCLAERTILCRDCGRRIWTDENEGSEDHPPLPALLRAPLHQL